MVKINALEIENLKRIKAVALTPNNNGLTVIGGNNGQGKTSVLDAIAWALGGNSYKPSSPHRDGSMVDPSINITLSNGIRVERSGKNSNLKVTDIHGNMSGQTLLNAFISKLALDLPAFMAASNKDKAKTLLTVIGVNDQLNELERKESALYNERLYVGRTADQKRKLADGMESFADAPSDLISPAELVKRQQDILARNGQNDAIRRAAGKARADMEVIKAQLDLMTAQYQRALQRYEEAAREAQALSPDESTAEIEQAMLDVENINRRVRANLDKAKAEEDARQYEIKYASMTEQLEKVRSDKMALLNGARLPLPELSVEEGELTYKGHKWDCLSGSGQLIVAAAIVQAVNPECGFILLDKLEQLDMNTLREFGDWLTAHGLQAIATRVSTGDECSIIICDGYAAEDQAANAKTAACKWEAGQF